MSPSSSGSWSGGGGARGGDIIDLDRYMRGHVRPSRTSSEERQQCDQFVVDGGGIGRKLVSDIRYKRNSHDSGVSDGSYDKRRPYRPRRVSNSDGRFHTAREQTSARTFTRQGHSDSLQAFRTIYEQALLDQQKQIARVAQLCERLTERADERLVEDVERPERIDERLSARGNERQIADQKPSEKTRNERKERTKPLPSDTSDISSSSRSTSDQRRKEKHRTQECKTYKIIMSKLDELNRRFGLAHPSPPPLHPPPRPQPPSSGSVSVCDKLVATDLHLHRTVDKVIRPTVQKRQFQSSSRAASPTSMLTTTAPALGRARVVAQAYNVDIAPRQFMLRTPNVATESVVKCESNCGSGSCAGDPRCNFDLEDPVHLYSQAKRLQALNATIRRARSHSSADSRSNARADSSIRCSARADSNARASKVRERSPSICSVCRGYWRSLRQCIVAPFSQDCKCS